MNNTSPPLSPVGQQAISLESPGAANGGAGANKHIRRRTSSFSDRSSMTPRSRHRFSNASQMSDGTTGGETGGGGMGDGGVGLGNLADELDQLDDEYEEEYEDDSALLEHGGGGPEVRDSGIDVSYSRKLGSPSQKPPDDQDDHFSPELDELLSAIAHMSSSLQPEDADPLIPRALAQFQDLGPQTGLEAGTQRLTTSTNSLAAHLATQSKTLQTLAQSLSPIFTGIPSSSPPPTMATTPSLPRPTSPLSQVSSTTELPPTNLQPPFSPPAESSENTDPTLPMLDALRLALPHPDPGPLQGLRALERETADAAATLATLTDTLQMGRQATASASRHLRITRAMVEELRRERERADAARAELAREVDRGWEEKVRRRGCRDECAGIVSGFEENCRDLRRRMEGGVV